MPLCHICAVLNLPTINSTKSDREYVCSKHANMLCVLKPNRIFWPENMELFNNNRRKMFSEFYVDIQIGDHQISYRSLRDCIITEEPLSDEVINDCKLEPVRNAYVMYNTKMHRLIIVNNLNHRIYNKNLKKPQILRASQASQASSVLTPAPTVHLSSTPATTSSQLSSSSSAIISLNNDQHIAELPTTQTSIDPIPTNQNSLIDFTSNDNADQIDQNTNRLVDNHIVSTYRAKRQRQWVAGMSFKQYLISSSPNTVFVDNTCVHVTLEDKLAAYVLYYKKIKIG